MYSLLRLDSLVTPCKEIGLSECSTKSESPLLKNDGLAYGKRDPQNVFQIVILNNHKRLEARRDRIKL